MVVVKKEGGQGGIWQQSSARVIKRYRGTDYTLEGRVEARVPLECLECLDARDILDRRVLLSELKLPVREKISQ
jgi:hypothetical protein